jgi:hypothetical protein
MQAVTWSPELPNLIAKLKKMDRHDFASLFNDNKFLSLGNVEKKAVQNVFGSSKVDTRDGSVKQMPWY